jgi:PAS domain S-box-containing protein
MVALATLARWLIGEVIEGAPFITFFPAVVVAALVGGFWPGILATVLSSIIAWFMFLPPTPGWLIGGREIISLSLFVFVAGINVVIVALLNAAVERVLAQEQNTRVLIESAPYGIIVVDERGTITLANEATEQLFGYARDELVGQSIDVLVPPDHLDAHRAARKQYLLRPEKRTFRDLSARRKDGSEFPVDIGLDPISRNGRTGVLATVIDISARKQVQQHQQLIIRELQHRTNNLFAVIQAIIGRTVQESTSAAELKDALNGRIQALARAYATLTDTMPGAPLAQILDRELAGFGRRVSISGCDILVSPWAAQQFALIIHELATNAIKYGALSNATGQVSVEGARERRDGGGVFAFRWTETAGPPVSPPTRKGFGSVILLDSARQFAHSVSLDYAPHGLHYSLQVRFDAIDPARQRPGTTPV